MLFRSRAGRRGIDDVGYAVVLWSPFVPFDQVAGLASTRTYALSSSFRPTYNMAANLVRRYPADVAHHLLNLSFAQYRADADVVRLEAQLERNSSALAEARERAHCHLGDVAGYRAHERTAASPPDADVAEALGKLRPGDVLVVPGGKSGGRVAVLATAQRRGSDVRVIALTPDRRKVTLSPRDFRTPPRPRARVTLPVPYAPANRTFQRSVAQALTKARLSGGEEHGSPRDKPARGRHPVAACPDARAHLRAAERAERLEAESAWVERRIRGRTESLARQFDRVLRVMETWGYVEGWALTDAGGRLARVYHECDLLIAEVIGEGLFDGLDAPGVAALASAFTYEHRRPGPPPAPRFPTTDLRRRWQAVEDLAKELNRAEKEVDLPLTRAPDPGFMVLASAWASGEALEDVVAGDDMSGGDFVRNIKQLVDLLRQLGDASPVAATSTAARRAAEQIFRGVVAASSVVGTGPLPSK